MNETWDEMWARPFDYSKLRGKKEMTDLEFNPFLPKGEVPPEPPPPAGNGPVVHDQGGQLVQRPKRGRRKQEAAPVGEPKRKGRPKGSKNKAKSPPTKLPAAAPVQASKLDLAAVISAVAGLPPEEAIMVGRMAGAIQALAHPVRRRAVVGVLSKLFS